MSHPLSQRAVQARYRDKAKAEKTYLEASYLSGGFYEGAMAALNRKPKMCIACHHLIEWTGIIWRHKNPKHDAKCGCRRVIVNDKRGRT